MSAAADSPFLGYPGGGRELLGRPRQGDLTARKGYGPPVFALCGFSCAYCGFEMSQRYEDWLQLSVDHVVPGSARSRGYPYEWLEDVTNLVTCCRPCNEFSNAFAVLDPVPSDIAGFFDVRDRVFQAKRDMVLDKHARERRWHAERVLSRGEATGPGLPADPTP